jgi:hypothetical protein
MATVVKKTLMTLLHSDEVESNPLTMTDEQILDQIYSTHVHNSDTKFDAASLFTLAHNTLARSTHIVDSVVQVYILYIIHLLLLMINFSFKLIKI